MSSTTRGTETPSSRDGLTLAVFTAASFLGSTLLFLVQPLVGRLLLPRAGGSAGLWSTAMAFFQVVLVLGYLFAHVSITRVGVRRHRVLHLGVLAVPVLVLPLAVPEDWVIGASAPIASILWVLVLMAGLPFFALSTASPSLQRWFADTGHRHAHDPYFLYGAGNLGSALGLLGYPLLIEPRVGLSGQTKLFAVAYGLFVAATLACALLVRSGSTGDDSANTRNRSPVPWNRRLRWVALAAVPSALLLGVTRHIATDVASFPLLWVVPLTLYLLTFVIAFRPGSDRWLNSVNELVILGVIAVAVSFVGLALSVTLVLHLAWFFAAALLGHLRLAADRPEVAQLTEFYAWLSIGGALGGTTIALLAPTLLDRVWEYPIAIAAAVMLALPRFVGTGEDVESDLTTAARNQGLVSWPSKPNSITPVIGAAAGVLALGIGVWLRSQDKFRFSIAAFGVGMILVLLSSRSAVPLAGAAVVVMVFATTVGSSHVIHRDRSFFGTYEVQRVENKTELVMGTTVHGHELIGAPGVPTAYYYPGGPVGDVLGPQARDGAGVSQIRTGIVGLGAGGIAAYGEPGDRMVFYEIDPTVVEIAKDERFFEFLANTEAEVEIQVGDGRRLLEEEDEEFDVLIVDAFSSDSIPIHLLTAEAVQLYIDRVDDGVVLFHISNRHFDLRPALGRIAEHLGIEATVRAATPSRQELSDGARSGTWVALTPPDSRFSLDGDWRPAPVEGRLWTDDYADVLSMFTF